MNTCITFNGGFKRLSPVLLAVMLSSCASTSPVKPYAVDQDGKQYSVDVQTVTMMITPTQAETGSTVQMRLAVPTRLPIPGFAISDALNAEVSWSVNTVNPGVRITPQGLLTVTSQARHNSLHQVIAKVAGRTQPVTTKVRVFSKTADPLIGHWKDKNEVINELLFQPGNRFSVTRIPFESYKDYGGTYRIDPVKRTVSMTITGGNKVPKDANLSNIAYSFDAAGNLVLKNVFFGTIRAGDQKQNQYVFTR